MGVRESCLYLCCAGRGTGSAYLTFIESQWPAESALFHGDHPGSVASKEACSRHRVIGRVQPRLGSSTQDPGEGLWFYTHQKNIFWQRLWFMHVKLSKAAAPFRILKCLGLSLPFHLDGDEREVEASQLPFS